MFGKQTFQSQE